MWPLNEAGAAPWGYLEEARAGSVGSVRDCHVRLRTGEYAELERPLSACPVSAETMRKSE